MVELSALARTEKIMGFTMGSIVQPCTTGHFFVVASKPGCYKVFRYWVGVKEVAFLKA